jgi:predicted MFS family arabinose efflux permease
MGVLSMSYFVAFVLGVGAGSVIAKRLGWHSVFACLSAAAAIVIILTVTFLPGDTRHAPHRSRSNSFSDHFRKSDRLAGVVAAFLTSGGIVGFLTYVGAWMRTSYGMDVERIGFLFVVSGLAAVISSPLSGWLADHAGKRYVIIWTNLVLAVLFVVVARSQLGLGLVLGIAALSIAAAARQAPLHALTTEIVPPEIRGEYVAVRNAASQLGIATVATISATAFDASGFLTVAWIAAAATLLIPVCCVWLKEPIQPH